jgi:hypothetical protein
VVDRSTGRIYAVTDDGDLHTVSLADGSELAAALPLVPNPATNYVWGGLNLCRVDCGHERGGKAHLVVGFMAYLLACGA